MAGENYTRVTEFIFTGLKCHRHAQGFLFLLLLLFHLVTTAGNLGMVTLILMDSRLHTPRCFFLSHLSFVDVCFHPWLAPRCSETSSLKGKPFLSWAAPCSSGSLGSLWPSSAFSWHPWLMTATWPSVTHCCSQLSRPTGSAYSWWSDPALLDS